MEYRDLNSTEIASIVSFAITFDCEKARRLFSEKFDKDPPPARTLLDWKKRFLETLTVLPRGHTSDQSDKRLSSEKRAEVVQAFGDDPHTSQRKVAQQCAVSLSSVNRILKDEGLRPWKVKWVQELHEQDHISRKEFCSTILRKNDENNDFVRNICFSDEAIFHVNGCVNKHNHFIYGYNNPRAIEEEPMRSPSITCWAMISERHGIIYRILHSTVTGDVYKDLLESVVPSVFKGTSNRLWLQQDGAPAHFSINVRRYLDENLTGRWIGRGGPIAWPPRSPDLSINDFWLWGDVRDRLYRRPRPSTIRELEVRLISILDSIPMSTIRKSFDSFLKRCRLCEKNGGGHFEHLL